MSICRTIGVWDRPESRKSGLRPSDMGRPILVTNIQLIFFMGEELTFGQKAVGLTFNPSGDERVTSVKQDCAHIIDNLNDLRNKTESGEMKRLLSIAITEIQGAQMWAVKAITWKD